jgi:hypothetical protein
MSRSGLGFAALVLLAAVPAEAARKPPPPPAKPAVSAFAAPTVRSGVEMWRNGDYAGAVAMWQPFANSGDMDALFNMGQAYKLGRAVPKDLAIARDYYRRAAVKGHLPAQANLGILLFQAGEKPEAVRWLKAAADKNEMRAQYVLGVALWNGDGVPRSLTLAYAYLARSSAQGLAEATTSLNSLTTMISPLERANGWAVATSLAAGNGVPPEFAGGVPKTTMAATEIPSRDQMLKPSPKPMVAEVAKPDAARIPAAPPTRTLANSPQPQVSPPPPPLIAKPLPPASIQPARTPPAPSVPTPRPVMTASSTTDVMKAPASPPPPLIAKPPAPGSAQAVRPAAIPPASKPVVIASAAPAIVKAPPVVANQPENSAAAPPLPTPKPVDRPAAPAVTTVDIPAMAPPVAAPLPAQKPVQPIVAAPQVSKPVQVAVAAPPAPKPVAKPAEKPVVQPAAPKPTGWRVQLGAFSKKALAEAAWTDVKTKQKQLVADKKPIYETDGSVIKLQLGPYTSKTTARDACAKIAFSGRACFVTEG